MSGFGAFFMCNTIYKILPPYLYTYKYTVALYISYFAYYIYIPRYLVPTSVHITSFTMTFLECLSQTKYKNTLMYWSYFWLGQNREGFWESVGLQETIVSKSRYTVNFPK